MNKSNFLVVGLGSIGNRHLRNLLDLGYAVSAVSSKTTIEVTTYTSISKAFSEKHFTHVIIATPTAFHIQALSEVLLYNPLFIYVEKPISLNLQNIDEIKKIANSKNIKIVVGYDLRFDPGLQQVKKWLDANKIGRMLNINAKVGQYLPQWRPHENYKNGMSAKIEMGGGVLLDLVHEWDYLLWIMGSIKNLSAFIGKNEEMDIETEDLCNVIFESDDGVIGSLQLDYWQPGLVRDCLITGVDGSIYWDLSKKKVELRSHNGQNKVFGYESFERNDRFVAALSAFASDINDSRLVPFEQGIMSLTMAVRCKESAILKQVIKIK